MIYMLYCGNVDSLTLYILVHALFIFSLDDMINFNDAEGCPSHFKRKHTQAHKYTTNNPNPDLSV